MEGTTGLRGWVSNDLGVNSDRCLNPLEAAWLGEQQAGIAAPQCGVQGVIGISFLRVCDVIAALLHLVGVQQVGIMLVRMYGVLELSLAIGWGAAG